jgi:hypothetical protein
MNYTELCETILEDYGRYWIENIPNDCNSITNINFNVSYYIYTNTYISLKLLEEYKLTIDTSLQSQNKNITWKFICENPHISWNWRAISEHSNITWKIIYDNPDKPWNYISISRNPNITWNIIKNNLHHDWYWDFISYHRNITWEDIQDIFLNYNDIISLSMSGISINPNVTCKIVKNNLNLEWDWYYLSYNPNIEIDFVKENLNKMWNWRGLSQNKNITWKMIKDNPQLPWDWSAVGENPNVTWDIIIDNYNEKWSWLNISLNPNIMWEIIKSNKDKPWRFDVLGYNSFDLDKDNFIRNKLREWFRRSTLKEELIAKLWHPRNYNKFKYYDPDMFDSEEDEKEEE